MKSDPNFSAAANCSELEKLVGRRTNPGVSLAEQQERFPFLKDAPVEHAYAAGVKVTCFTICSCFDAGSVYSLSTTLRLVQAALALAAVVLLVGLVLSLS